jgi:hypothetical protein
MICEPFVQGALPIMEPFEESVPFQNAEYCVKALQLELTCFVKLYFFGW